MIQNQLPKLEIKSSIYKKDLHCMHTLTTTKFHFEKQSIPLTSALFYVAPVSNIIQWAETETWYCTLHACWNSKFIYNYLSLLFQIVYYTNLIQRKLLKKKTKRFEWWNRMVNFFAILRSAGKILRMNRTAQKFLFFFSVFIDAFLRFCEWNSLYFRSFYSERRMIHWM